MSRWNEKLMRLAAGTARADEELEDFQTEALADGSVRIVCYLGYESRVLVPEQLDGRRVTEIGAEAFCENDLEAVKLPDTVVRIGNGAFARCRELRDVRLPSGLRSIGREAFSHCAMEEAALPDAVACIGASAFAGCRRLRRVSLPASLMELGESAFAGCGQLEEISVPQGHQRYAVQAGALVDMEAQTLLAYPAARALPGGEALCVPTGIVRIADHAFAGSCLTAAELPGTVAELGREAFAECRALERLELPVCLRWLGVSALRGTGLRTVRLPHHVTEIPADLFDDCRQLEEAVIPDGVTRVGTDAFVRCRALRRVTIPQTVTWFGGHVFESCSDDLCLAVQPGSAAEAYARENGLNVCFEGD